MITMKQMSIRLPDIMMDWLELEAEKNKRSVNRQIEYLIENIMQPQKVTGVNIACNEVHFFASNNPATSEPCNCGAFVYGEVIR